MLKCLNVTAPYIFEVNLEQAWLTHVILYYRLQYFGRLYLTIILSSLGVLRAAADIYNMRASILVRARST